MDKKAIPVGIENFKELRKEEYYITLTKPC